MHGEKDGGTRASHSESHANSPAELPGEPSECSETFCREALCAIDHEPRRGFRMYAKSARRNFRVRCRGRAERKPRQPNPEMLALRAAGLSESSAVAHLAAEWTRYHAPEPRSARRS